MHLKSLTGVEWQGHQDLITESHFYFQTNKFLSNPKIKPKQNLQDCIFSWLGQGRPWGQVSHRLYHLRPQEGDYCTIKGLMFASTYCTYVLKHKITQVQIRPPSPERKARQFSQHRPSSVIQRHPDSRYTKPLWKEQHEIHFFGLLHGWLRDTYHMSINSQLYSFN